LARSRKTRHSSFPPFFLHLLPVQIYNTFSGTGNLLLISYFADSGGGAVWILPIPLLDIVDGKSPREFDSKVTGPWAILFLLYGKTAREGGTANAGLPIQAPQFSNHRAQIPL
jgi:hypothetical protein